VNIVQAAAHSLGQHFVIAKFGGASDFDAAFASLVPQHLGALPSASVSAQSL
jgi:hypothetical protein